jgi:hypothetical protein
MPADVSYPHASYSNASSPAVEATASGRLPLGVGLVIAACASVGLWFGIGVGVKALFF